MVILLIAALLADGAETKTCPDGSTIRTSERCIELPDHRTQFSVAPAVTTQTVEWSCSARTAMTRIRIVALPYVNERGEPLRNHRFRVELVDVRVDGRPPSPIAIERLRSALAPLNSLSQLHGRCFTDRPVVFVSGSASGESGRQPRTTEIELK